MNFWPTGLYVLSSISRTLHNFSIGFFSMYRGILELKNDTRILRKNESFPNKTCCVLTVKTSIYFCRYNFANKQIKKIPNIVFSYRLQLKLKIFRKIFTVLKIEPQINGHLLKMSLYIMKELKNILAYCAKMARSQMKRVAP